MESRFVISKGDSLLLKKPHACADSANEFLVLRLGSDIRIMCKNCNHEVLVPRVKLEKSIKKVITNVQE